MLKIDNLSAEIDGKQILNGLTLEVAKGEIHAIMGPNGAGKSTLAYVLGGRPGYEVTGGSISFDGKDLLPILTLASKTSAHKCIFYWKGCTDSKTCGLPEDSPLVNKKDPGLWAVRCGSYKTHFVGESASRAFSSLQTCFL